MIWGTLLEELDGQMLEFVARQKNAVSALAYCVEQINEWSEWDPTWGRVLAAEQSLSSRDGVQTYKQKDNTINKKHDFSNSEKHQFMRQNGYLPVPRIIQMKILCPHATSPHPLLLSPGSVSFGPYAKMELELAEQIKLGG